MQTLVDLFEVHASASTSSTVSSESAAPAPQGGRETLLDVDEIAWEETFQTGESLPRHRGARFWSSED